MEESDRITVEGAKRCSATIRHSNPIRPIINDNGTEAGANHHAYGLYARLMRTGQKSTCGAKLP